jgi:hypothetical protein
MQNCGDLLAIFRGLQAPRLHGAHKTVEMIVEPEEPAIEDMDHVIDSV